MSFLVAVFYLVEPRKEFADHLRGRVPEDLAEILLEPLLFRNMEVSPGRQQILETVARTKLLFLASLRQYELISGPAEFAAVFGSATIIDLQDFPPSRGPRDA